MALERARQLLLSWRNTSSRPSSPPDLSAVENAVGLAVLEFASSGEDVAQLRQVKAFDGHKDKVYREVLFLDDRLTPEGGMLFAGDSTGAIYQWDIGRRALSHSWKAHEGSVWGMLMASFALISGGLDGMVKLWDPRTRSLLRQLYKHTSSVCSFSVQANVFYSCAVDNIIKVWDWKDGTCLGTMHGHRETVANLCLTPEGTLFSSGIDKMVKVWKPPGTWGEEVTVGDLRDAVFWPVETSGPDDADLGAVVVSHQLGAFLIGDGDDLGGGIRHGDNQGK